MATYKKELMDSLYLSARLSSYTALTTFLVKKSGMMNQPCLKLDVMDILKLAGMLTTAIVVDDYAVSKGWYPDKLSK